ncbi:MAG: helix-turn-helix transcriptional regulator [Treponema sp.]|jgi:transcriptional regulator with XRE-family HTH domain|nr:helix-turn-helix transcriptional regulator [Treponema sp.]
MVSSINSRLKSIRKFLKLSQKDFSEGIYISQSYYNEIEQGRKNINQRIIELVATKYNASREWIASGRGSMWSEAPPNIRLEQMISVFSKLNETFQDYVLRQTRELLKMQKQRPDHRNRS